MRALALVAVSVCCASMLVSVRTAKADPPGNFPLYRTIGEAVALTDIEDSYATETVSTETGLLTGTAFVVPDLEEWALVAEVSCVASGVGDYIFGLAGASQSVDVLDNNTNSEHGGVLGFLTTVVGGQGTAFAVVAAGNGESTWNGISIEQNPDGVFVTANGNPILVAGGDGVPLEVTLPVSPGEHISMAVWATVPNTVGGADQGSATAAASVVPLDSPPLARVVIRDERGDIVDSWEADPPPPNPCCP